MRAMRLMVPAPSGPSCSEAGLRRRDVPLGGPRKTPAGDGGENGLLPARTVVEPPGQRRKRL